MGFYAMIAVAASASLDGFFAGLALGSESNGNTQRKIFMIMCVVSAMCAVAFISARALRLTLKSTAERIGGAILVAVGLIDAARSLKATKKPIFVRNRRVNLFYDVILPGIGIGMDGACATASLALSGYGIICAVAVAALHYIFIELGSAICRIKLPDEIKEGLSPALLITLGIFKLI